MSRVKPKTAFTGWPCGLVISGMAWNTWKISELASMTQTVFPALHYRDADAALSFLTAAFGATEKQVHRGEDGTIHHAELLIEGSLIMFGQAHGSGAAPTAESGDEAPEGSVDTARELSDRLGSARPGPGSLGSLAG